MSHPTIHKRVAVVEFDDGGHNRWFFRCHVKALLELGCQVVAISPFSSAELGILQNEFGDRLITKDFCSTTLCEEYARKLARSAGMMEPVWNAATRSRYVRLCKLLKATEKEIPGSIDLIYFSCLWLREITVGSKVLDNHGRRWSGLYLHLNGYRTEKNVGIGFKNQDISEAPFGRSCLGLQTLDEGAVDWLQQKYQLPVTSHPDLVHVVTNQQTTAFANTLKKKANGRKIVSICGHLVSTKGLSEFVKVAQLLKEEPLFFVAVGKLGVMDTEVQGLFSRVKRGEVDNMFIHDERIEAEEEFNGVFEASDLVWVAYKGFPNSSNIQGKAVAFKKSSIVSDGYLMAERSRKFNLGPIVKEGEIGEISQAILALRDGNTAQNAHDLAEFESYLEEHSFNRLQSMFQKLISEVKTS